MRYTICVNMPGCLPEQEPYEVNGLDAAREAALDEVWCSNAYEGVDPEPDLEACRNLPAGGGVIGPRPDGYVIDVRATPEGVI